MKDECIAIVDSPFAPEEAEPRWSGERFRLSAEHLGARQAGKTAALDVIGEYVTFITLEKTANGQ